MIYVYNDYYTYSSDLLSESVDSSGTKQSKHIVMVITHFLHSHLYSLVKNYEQV